MTAGFVLFVLLLTTIYFFGRKRQLSQRFNRSVEMKVNYMFQERPGQYSGDRSAKSGIFIFKAVRNHENLKNIVIRDVKPLHSALRVNLEQILIIPFGHRALSNVDVSVRFKVVKKNALITDLKGGRISISGVLNFEQGRSESFETVLSIADLYLSAGLK